MRQNPETIIHRAVVDHLRRRAYPDVLWFHVPNGGKRHIATAVAMKRLGVLAGVSDLLLFRRGEKFALELKSPNGRPTEAQLEFQSRWRAFANGHAFVAEGQDEAVKALELWELIRPDTWQQIGQAADRVVTKIRGAA